MQNQSHCRNLFQKALSKFGFGTAALLVAVTSGYAAADDTEIFFGKETTQPNILLILDTSLSMTFKDGGTTTRLDRIKVALNEILTHSRNANIGLMEFSGTGIQLRNAVKPLTDAHTADLLETINNLDLDVSTPTVRALLEGARYFKGEPLTDLARLRAWDSETHTYTCDKNDVNDSCFTAPTRHRSRTWGTRDWKWTAARRKFDESAYILGPASGSPALEAGSFDRHDHCTPDNLTHASCGKEQITGNASYKSPITSECQSNHMVLLTDGEPWRNSGFFYSEAFRDFESEVEAELKLDACNATGYPNTDKPEGRCATDISNYLSNTDISDVSGNNHVTTHTIGLEINIPWLVSISDASEGGTHHKADSAESLVDAFASIVAVAQSELNSFASPAITLDELERNSHREDIYLSLFEPSANAMWPGNLKRYNQTGGALTDVNGSDALDANGSIKASATSWWSNTADGGEITLGGAANKLDANTRNVYTNISGNELNTASGNNDVHESNDLISIFTLGGNLSAVMTDDERSNILQWTRGVDVLDYDDDPATTTRQQMGDPLHSQAVLVTYSVTPATTTEPAIRNSVAFVGTNQGYLHAIDTITGEEVFSFIPEDLLPNLQTFYKNERRLTKLYGLDGDITSWVHDNNNDGSIGTDADDHAYLYIGMRRGGSNYYALDVTDKDYPKILWTIEGGPGGDSGFEDLGQSWSKPTPATIMYNSVPTKVLVFAGGYDSMQDNTSIRSADTIGNALFIVNATTGDLIWKTDAIDYPDMIYSIPSNPTLIDVNGDGLTDVISVGDVGGQVWRFDVDNRTTTFDLIKGGVVADLAADPDGNTTGNNRKFFDAPKLAVIEDFDGSHNLMIAIGSGNRAHPLETSNVDRFYMLKQDGLNAPDEYGMVVQDYGAPSYRSITENDLYNATANDIQSTDATTASTAADLLAEAPGWMIELTTSGEKVTSTATLANNVLSFNTYVPAQVTDVCAPSLGSSRLYRIHALDATPANENTNDEDNDYNNSNDTDSSTGNESRYDDSDTQDGLTSAPQLALDNGNIETRVGTTIQNTIQIPSPYRSFWYER